MKIQQTLKFRAWDVFYKKFVYSDQDLLSSFWLMVEHGITAGREVPVERWTGLKDKNGKDIYEGDIVQMMQGKYVQKAEVVYRDGCFFPFNGDDCGCCSMEAAWLVKNAEVMGNIYENPNLLTPHT